jgi:AcrR family transcriptional regulator
LFSDSTWNYRQRITEKQLNFQEYGIKAVTMDMLAANLGISNENNI